MGAYIAEWHTFGALPNPANVAAFAEWEDAIDYLIDAADRFADEAADRYEDVLYEPHYWDTAKAELAAIKTDEARGKPNVAVRIDEEMTYMCVEWQPDADPDPED